MTLEEIVNSLKSAGQDYGQLFNNNPKYTAVASNVTKGLENLVPPQFTNTQDAKSQEYSKKLAEWALGNGMGMSGMALAVSGYGGAKNIGDILNKKYGENIEADISGNNKGLTLNKIIVDKEKRNQGLGSSFLKDLTKYADLNKQPISLTAGGDFGGNKARQINLYKKFGFLENKGKNKDYSISENMYRNPIESNLNADLLKKYLSTGKLSPKEMAQYEANGLAMETPQLQRYNVANAMANPERNAHMSSYDVLPYHGTNDVITSPDYAFSGKGADQLGSAALYTSAQPSLASGYVKPDISGGNVLPLALRNTNKYMSDELEKKLTPAQIREFITKSPDEYALSNFGDVGYEGKNKVINTAVQGYHQYGDEKLLDTLNTLNNDFYTGHPEEFNKLAEKLTKKAGVVMDTGENKIYATWNPKDIRSRFAAFDPLRKNSSSLLASGLLGALLFNNENKTSENK